MTVRTERTPNPNSLKYHLGKLLIPGGSANFPSVSSAEGRSPLATKLFEVKGVVGVFIGSDFITITREDGQDWADINAGVAPALEAFFESGEAVLTGKPMDESHVNVADYTDKDADPAVIGQIQNLINEKVRPAVAQDGGDIIYRGYKEGIVYLEMYGACSGCPSAGLTLKSGIESMLRHHLPEAVKEVQQV